MRKSCLFMFIIALASLQARADEVVKIVSLEKAGTLDAMLGTERSEIDSIVVSGPMNAADWESLRSCCMLGRVHGMDLSDVRAENDSMPAKALGHMSFRSSLKYLRLPQTLTVIGPMALRWCTSLEHVDLPVSLKRIGYQAFEICTSLRHILLPESLEVVSSQAFATTGLESVVLPGGVKCLGDEVFAACVNMKEAIIPEKIEDTMGWGTFRGCWALEKVSIPSDTDNIPGSMFEDCEMLSDFQWPSCLQSIGSSAFEACPMARIVLPEGLRDIGRNAFRYNTSLVSLVLPSTLSSVHETVLIGCGQSLAGVYCQSVMPPMVVAAGSSIEREESLKAIRAVTLYVPKGSSAAYSTATYWQSFADIVELDIADFPTAVSYTLLNRKPDARLYGLDGRMMTTPAKGMVISNGRKYVITKRH